jgi:hypothetical protein
MDLDAVRDAARRPRLGPPRLADVGARAKGLLRAAQRPRCFGDGGADEEKEREEGAQVCGLAFEGTAGFLAEFVHGGQGWAGRFGQPKERRGAERFDDA